MSEAETLFAALRQSSGDDAVTMLERMVRDAPDHALTKINALDLAAKEGIGEEQVIAALLNAVGLGIFEMSWNVMCPSCAGVISANKSLKTLDRAQYHCAFCAAGYETTLDNLVEVTFTVSPRVRKIAAHNPDALPAAEYYRQIFWSSAIDLPADLEKLLREVTLESIDLPSGERHADRLRPGDAHGPVPRRQGRGGERTPEPVHDLQKRAGPRRDLGLSPRAAAPRFGEPHR